MLFAPVFALLASCVSLAHPLRLLRLVSMLFEMARDRAPCIIFIDEVDSLCGARSDTESESSRRIKTEFLVQVGGSLSFSFFPYTVCPGGPRDAPVAHLALLPLALPPSVRCKAWARTTTSRCWCWAPPTHPGPWTRPSGVGTLSTQRVAPRQLWCRVASMASPFITCLCPALTSLSTRHDPLSFEKRIYIPLPDIAARTAMFKLHLGDTEHTLKDSDFVELARKSDG